MPVREGRGEGREGSVVQFPDSPTTRLHRIALLAGLLDNWSIDFAEEGPHTAYLSVEMSHGTSLLVTPAGVRYGLIITRENGPMTQLHDLTEAAAVAQLVLNQA
ncbi:hypothetical protein [Devosia enhydra]|uniref:hypothetical protein n=1 Tax=Devosia enhydra TaxID=665118 RepID=UPI0011605264|nr:hypothetical protein [Devosia enhydra]